MTAFESEHIQVGEQQFEDARRFTKTIVARN
jgi:hypothetical protein